MLRLELAPILVSLICSAHEVSPGRAAKLPSGHVLGLVSIEPKGHVAGSHEDPAHRNLSIFEMPRAGAKVTTIVTDLRRMDWEEYDDSVRPLVYQRDGDWLQIRVDDKPGWIAPGDHGAFASLFEILQKQQAYLRSNWDRRLWPDPAEPTRAETLPRGEPKELGVQVLAEKTIERKAWFKIRFERVRCGFEVGSGQEGWIPAYATPSKAPNLWYNPKGC